MKNLIVTTPKSEMENSAKEAQACINSGGGCYFRKFIRKPKELESGSKIYYVEDGYIRGFGVVASVEQNQKRCDVTGRDWGEAYFAIIPACTWTWIKPVSMNGFQGYRYFDDSDIEVAGGWLDPKPLIDKN